MTNRTGKCAFTLVELLVCIGVIAVLIAIALPSLSSARSSSRRLKSLSNLHSLGSIVSHYQSDNADNYPRIIEGKWYHTVDSLPFIFPFWQISTTWVAVVVDYMPTSQYHDLVHCPASFRDENDIYDMTSYFYSWSFVCPPAYWKNQSPDLSVVTRGVRLADVAFPSNKVLLWDDDAGYLAKSKKRIGADISIPVPILLADLSGHTRRPSDAKDAVMNPQVPTAFPIRLLATEDGVRGTDY